VDKDTISVHYYTVIPDFYVPSAFSPNGDGLNDVIKPITLGLRSIDVFSIYNRWGQQVFTTSQMGAGWDGRFKGKLQDAGTFVWFAEGTDYTNQKLKRKGTVVLVR
jgi:gliding motility-associated-like protein